MEQCENCGRTIGKLETPHVHDGHIVCAQCDKILQPAGLDEADSAGIAYEARLEPVEESREQAARRMRSKAKHFAPPKYRDYLAVPRFIMLLVAIGSCFVFSGPNILFCYLLWAAWIALGIAGIVMKANWKARNGL
jgi:hypothetical protein